MEKVRKHNVTMIRRSCITGKIVWVYRGMSRNAGYVAYHRAVKHEIERVKHWPEYVAERKAKILKFLSDRMAHFPLDAVLTPEQKAAARTIRKIAETEPELDLDFYNHVIEEQNRRNLRKQTLARMRAERDNKDNK